MRDVVTRRYERCTRRESIATTVSASASPSRIAPNSGYPSREYLISSARLPSPSVCMLNSGPTFGA